MKSLFTLPCAFLLLATACSGSKGKEDDARPHFETLSQTVTMFNEALHWGNTLEASNWLDVKSLPAFQEAILKSRGVRVLEVEVEGILPQPKGRVTAMVRFLWTPKDSISTEECLLVQTWRPSGKVWMISSSVPQECNKTIYAFDAPPDTSPVVAPKRRSVIDK
jgi:hypothetical protein